MNSTSDRRVIDTGVYVPPAFWGICSVSLKRYLLGAYETFGMYYLDTDDTRQGVLIFFFL
jgi:hypothetical protein